MKPKFHSQDVLRGFCETYSESRCELTYNLCMTERGLSEQMSERLSIKSKADFADPKTMIF